MIYITTLEGKEMAKERLTIIDLAEIQESLEAYKLLLRWLPAPTVEEQELKRNRFSIIQRLQKVCENEMEVMRDE